MEILVGLVLAKNKPARPFLKWAGGKTQLLEKFEDFFPKELKEGKIKKYFEPFVGSGAVFFYLKQRFDIKRAYLADINPELILVYRVIQEDAKALIGELSRLSGKYIRGSEEARKLYYYKIRDKFNETRQGIDFFHYSEAWVPRAAQIIFMNKTCFNGLFRVNRNGAFNVPHGRYRNPKIVDADNLLNVSGLLRDVIIRVGDFECLGRWIDSHSFVYFDPPYRPLTRTASFTSYTQNGFGELDQIRLAEYFGHLDARGAKLLLSNSDPRNEDPKDRFFEEHYDSFQISRVGANRMINCDATKRGSIKEIVITNY